MGRLGRVRGGPAVTGGWNGEGLGTRVPLRMLGRRDGRGCDILGCDHCGIGFTHDGWLDFLTARAEWTRGEADG